jgi:hypothetical protein
MEIPQNDKRTVKGMPSETVNRASMEWVEQSPLDRFVGKENLKTSISFASESYLNISHVDQFLRVK